MATTHKKMPTLKKANCPNILSKRPFKTYCFVIFCFVIAGLQVIQAKPDSKDMFLFEFGPETGDRFLNKDLDACSSEHKLPTNFQFGGQQHSKLFVCVFGVLAFDRAMDSGSFDPSYFESEDHAMISPFYADTSLRDNFLDVMCINSTYQNPDTNEQYEPERVCDFFTNVTSGLGGHDEFYYSDVPDPVLRNDLADHLQRNSFLQFIFKFNK